MRKSAVMTVAATTAIALASGCGGDGGGAPRLTSGTHSVTGSCSYTDQALKEILIASVAGTVSASVTWADTTGDIDVYLHDYARTTDIDNDLAEPPNDSPAEVSGTVTEAMDVRIQIECYSGTDVAYTATVTVP